MTCKNLLWILIVISLSCCAPVASNLSPVFPKTKPRMKILKNPSLDSRQFRTFSVIPVSRLKKGPLLTNEIVELHMLFFLRNAFEFRGYKYVEGDEKPDFLATIDGLVSFKQDNFLPEALADPNWLPERELSKNLISERMLLRTYKIPAHSGGTVYPDIRIDVLDPEILKPLWAGIGWAAAKNPDLRISSQTIAIFLIGEFPQGPFSSNDVMGALGCAFYVFTNNGNDHYPTVFQVMKDSPADRAGVTKYDMIAYVDGHSLKNKPLSEVIEIFRKGLSDKRTLTILRGGKKIDVGVSLISRGG